MSIDISTIQRHSTLYAPTGDVVILAPASEVDSDPRYIAFRLHTSTILLWSPYFGQVLGSTIRSLNVDDLYDGAPVVLMPDSASDLETLLNAAVYG